jgi:hypothetical protein
MGNYGKHDLNATCVGRSGKERLTLGSTGFGRQHLISFGQFARWVSQPFNYSAKGG